MREASGSDCQWGTQDNDNRAEHTRRRRHLADSDTTLAGRETDRLRQSTTVDERITQRRSQHGTVDAWAGMVACRDRRERAFFEHALVECILLHVFTDRTEAKGVSGWRVFRRGVARTKTGGVVSQHLDV